MQQSSWCWRLSGLSSVFRWEHAAQQADADTKPVKGHLIVMLCRHCERYTFHKQASGWQTIHTSVVTGFWTSA